MTRTFFPSSHQSFPPGTCPSFNFLDSFELFLFLLFNRRLVTLQQFLSQIHFGVASTSSTPNQHLPFRINNTLQVMSSIVPATPLPQFAEQIFAHSLKVPARSKSFRMLATCPALELASQVIALFCPVLSAMSFLLHKLPRDFFSQHNFIYAFPTFELHLKMRRTLNRNKNVFLMVKALAAAMCHPSPHPLLPMLIHLSFHVLTNKFQHCGHGFLFLLKMNPPRPLHSPSIMPTSNSANIVPYITHHGSSSLSRSGFNTAQPHAASLPGTPLNEPSMASHFQPYADDFAYIPHDLTTSGILFRSSFHSLRWYSLCFSGPSSWQHLHLLLSALFMS